MVALLSQCRAAVDCFVPRFMDCFVPRFMKLMANQVVVVLMAVAIVSDEASMAGLSRLKHCFQIFSRLYSTMIQVQSQILIKHCSDECQHHSRMFFLFINCSHIYS